MQPPIHTYLNPANHLATIKPNQNFAKTQIGANHQLMLIRERERDFISSEVKFNVNLFILMHGLFFWGGGGMRGGVFSYIFNLRLMLMRMLLIF